MKKNGFLIKDGDLKEFEDKLQILMCNKELRSEMGFYGKKLIAEKNFKRKNYSRLAQFN